MWWQFTLQNWHFIVNIFASLAFFSVSWLYVDALMIKRSGKDLIKVGGLICLSLAFLIHAAYIESTGLNVNTLGGLWNERISMVLRNIGYLMVWLSLALDPLMPKPESKEQNRLPMALMGIRVKSWSFFMTPLAAVLVAWSYLRRATIGLENHLKQVSLAFFLFSVYELLSIGEIFNNSANVDVQYLTSAFGPIWVVAGIVETLAVLILMRWAFSYLLKRINTQLFIIQTTLILIIFSLTSILFTGVLVNNQAEESLNRLNTDVSVLVLALDSKRIEIVSTAIDLANSSELAKATIDKNRKTITALTEPKMIARKLSGVSLVNTSGEVIVRLEDQQRNGESASNNNLIKRALKGETVTSFASSDGVISPIVKILGATPIKADNQIVGVVMVEQLIDNSFLDGVKKATNLEIGVYGDKTLSATTISAITQGNRPIGVVETDQKVLSEVISKGNGYTGLISFLNHSFLAAYRPIADIDNNVIGMLFVGRPASSVYEGVSKSIETTFLATIGLIFLSLLPSYLISKYIYYQLK